MNPGIFDHFDDPLDELIGGEPQQRTPPGQAGGFAETCPKCKGSKVFRGHSGRVVGPCFKCKGLGVLTFATSTEHRATSREKAAAKRQKNGGENMASFGEIHPKVLSWMLLKNTTFEFAASLLNAVKRHGELTEKQLAAAYRCVEQDEKRAEEKVQRQLSPVQCVAIDARKVQAAFDHAKAAGGTTAAGTKAKMVRPRMVCGGYKFSTAPDYGRNPGAIYVKRSGGNREFLGMILSGTFKPHNNCTAEDSAAITKIAADPEEASRVHGELTGSCGICGRTLTKHKSIDRGIGPICARRMGW